MSSACQIVYIRHIVLVLTVGDNRKAAKYKSHYNECVPLDAPKDHPNIYNCSCCICF